jgi:hypothetical protein
MKSHIKYLFFTLLTAASLLGCQTPPRQTALTPAILERIQKFQEKNLRNYPFILSDPIILHTVKNEVSSQNTTPPKIRRFERESKVNTGILFKDIIQFENIMLRKNIKGDFVKQEDSKDEILLHIYFEEKKDEAKKPSSTHYLVFAAKKSDKNSFFYLKYNPGPGRHQLSKEKGTLAYNENTYDVLFDGVTPYLLIWLDQILEAKTDTREIRGRVFKPKYLN